MRPPYWDTERDRPDPPAPPPHPASCAICGLEATSATIRQRPALYPALRSEETGEVVPGGYATVARCIEVLDCRTRLEARGEEWPLLEAGEDPRKPRLVRAKPMAAVETLLADVSESAPVELDEPEPEVWF